MNFVSQNRKLSFCIVCLIGRITFFGFAFFIATLPLRAVNNLEAILQLILDVDDSAFHHDLLKGMRDGLAGRRNLTPPPSWAKVSTKLGDSDDPAVREEVRLLGLAFGEESAFRALRAKVLDAKVPVDERRRALKVLVEKKADGLEAELKLLLADNALRIDALRGMAVFGGDDVPAFVLARYRKFNEGEKREMVQMLVSRPSYAAVLLEALAKGIIPRSGVSVFAVRQIIGFKDDKLNTRLREAWGEVRLVTSNKKPFYDKYRKLFTPENLKKADLRNGRLHFTRTCAACHKLYGEGGQIGPDITGSDRGTLDYLLENVLDPNAAIGKDYQLNVITTKDGRAVSGLIAAENANSLTVKTLAEEVVISLNDIVMRQVLPVSMMPEGIFQALSDKDVTDLAAYLMGHHQVELPK